MKPLELNVLFFEGICPELASLGIESDIDYTVDKMTFYSINSICRDNMEENQDYTTIYSNGEMFTCTEPYENVKRLIEENL